MSILADMEQKIFRVILPLIWYYPPAPQEDGELPGTSTKKELLKD